MGGGSLRGIATATATAWLVFVAPAPAQVSPGVGPRPGSAFDVSAAGSQPDVAVDPEGNAHIVWNESVKDGADVTHYCRVPRGARRCDIERSLVPTEADPAYNTDTEGPRVVVFGPDQIAVLTFRYPNVVTVTADGTRDPDCFSKYPAPGFCYGSSSKTYAFYSNDNGVTFGAEDVFSHSPPSGDAISLLADVPAGDGSGQTDTAPLLATISDTVTGGTFFASAPPLGYDRQNVNLGDGGPNRAYSGRLGVEGDRTPIATFADLDSQIYLRRYGGSGSLNSILSWPAAVPVARGEDPRISGGPGGVHLLYKPQRGTNYVVRRVNGTSLDAATQLSDSEATANPALFDDDGGGLHAAWVARTSTGDQLEYRWAPDGRTFGPAIRLASRPSGAVWNVQIAAADDGGGFAVFSSSLFDNGRVSVVPFGSRVKRQLVDARISAIEVTQAIQNADIAERPLRTGAAANTLAYRGVPLAEGQTTVVRVYARLRRAPRFLQGSPAMTLRVYRNGKPLPGPYLPDSVGVLPATAGDDIADAERANPQAAYSFWLPWQAATGTISLEAEINPQGLAPSLTECRLCRADNKLRVTGIQFQPTRPLRIVPISVTINGAKPVGYPDSSVPFAGVRAVTPMRVDVENYRTDIDVSDIQNIATIKKCFLFICGSSRAITLGEKTSMVRARVQDWADDNEDSSQVFPIGVFAAAALNAGGASSGGSTNSDGLIYGDDQPVSIVADNRPLTSVAHEVGHGLGRVHAGRTCGSNSNGQVGEPWPPNDDGALTASEYGMDRRTPSPFRPLVAGQAGQPATIYDLMSYCPTNGGANESLHWVSILNWTRMIDEQRSGQPAPRSVGRPRRSRVARISSAHPAAARSLRVLALISPDAEPTIISVTPDDGPPTPDQGNGLRFVGRSPDGTEVSSAGALVEPVHQDGVAGSQVVSGRIAAAGVQGVDLVRDGQPVAERVASKNAPTVRIVAPRRGATVGGRGNVSVRWKAGDKDGDPLLAIVQFSADGGRRWRTLKVAPSRGRADVPAALLAASRNARVRVRVQDGFHEALATSGRFRTRGAAPVVRITAPTRGGSLTAGASVSLAGEAYGSDGRTLGESALVWRDGRRTIGRGRQITYRGVAPGRRQITLTARAAGGPAGKATLTLDVANAQPHFTLLRAPAAVSRRARTVTVLAASAFPARLTAGSTRLVLGPARRRLRIRVKPGRSPLTIPVKLSSGKLAAVATLVVARR